MNTMIPDNTTSHGASFLLGLITGSAIGVGPSALFRAAAGFGASSARDRFSLTLAKTRFGICATVIIRNVFQLKFGKAREGTASDPKVSARWRRLFGACSH